MKDPRYRGKSPLTSEEQEVLECPPPTEEEELRQLGKPADKPSQAEGERDEPAGDRR